MSGFGFLRMIYCQISNIISNIVTSDVNFDTMEELVKATTLHELHNIKRGHNLYADYDLDVVAIDKLVASTAVEIMIHLSQTQEFYYKAGILDYLRNKLQRFVLVGLALSYIANKLIKLLILNGLLGFVKVGKVY